MLNEKFTCLSSEQIKDFLLFNGWRLKPSELEQINNDIIKLESPNTQFPQGYTVRLVPDSGAVLTATAYETLKYHALQKIATYFGIPFCQISGQITKFTERKIPEKYSRDNIYGISSCDIVQYCYRLGFKAYGESVDYKPGSLLVLYRANTDPERQPTLIYVPVDNFSDIEYGRHFESLINSLCELLLFTVPSELAKEIKNRLEIS